MCQDLELIGPKTVCLCCTGRPSPKLVQGTGHLWTTTVLSATQDLESTTLLTRSRHLRLPNMDSEPNHKESPLTAKVYHLAQENMNFLSLWAKKDRERRWAKKCHGNQMNEKRHTNLVQGIIHQMVLQSKEKTHNIGLEPS